MGRGQEGQPYSGAGANASGPPRPTSSSSSSGSGGGGGGGGGGFGSFEDDPILARTRALNQKLIENARSNALAARKQEQIRYGYDPNISYEDAATQEAARQNAFSTLAQLLYGHNDRALQLDEDLNKANLFYSGTRAKEIGKEGRQYTLEQTQANQGYQQRLNDIAQMVLQAQQEAQERELAAEEAAYERALSSGLGGLYSGGGGGGGGGGAGGLENPDQWAHNGFSGEQLNAAAAAYASSHPGYVPGLVQQEGHIEEHNGVPGVWIKYRTPAGDSTEWTPLG